MRVVSFPIDKVKNRNYLFNLTVKENGRELVSGMVAMVAINQKEAEKKIRNKFFPFSGTEIELKCI